MECQSTGRHFPNHSIKLFLVDAGGRGRCHLVKPTDIVRYLADHLTAKCSTPMFYNNAFAFFLCCFVCPAMASSERNRAPKLSFPLLILWKNTVVGISVLFVCARKRHVAAAGTQHLSVSALASFSGALLCNCIARALLHPLSTEHGLLAKRLPQPYNAVCAYHPNLAGIRFPKS